MSEFKSKIGGQALIEGVMMKGPLRGAMACRLPDGTIRTEEWDEHNVPTMLPWYKKVPFIRGTFQFVSSMRDGYRCLMRSAEWQSTDEKGNSLEELTPFEKWLESKLGEKLFGTLMTLAMGVALIVAVLLFLWLPKFLTGLLLDHTALNENNTVLRSLFEGIIKIIIFLGYMATTGMSTDMRRNYQYHGAEHKTIACYEAGEELTCENVRKHSRFHPRCGTSFIFITLIFGILVMCLVPSTVIWQRVIISICLLPVVMGCSYEFIRLAGKYSNPVTKALSFPGMQIQRITTREPDDSMIECAIAALKPCIPGDRDEGEQP